jgi:hypothetical protein
LKLAGLRRDVANFLDRDDTMIELKGFGNFGLDMGGGWRVILW